jgi:hypothetical protein
MSTQPLITPASKNPAGSAIGDRSLSYLVTKFLGDSYPSIAFLDSTPTSITVYHLKATQSGSDPKLSVPLRNLKLSEVVQLLKEFSFEVSEYQNGAGSTIGVYTVTGHPPTPGTAATFNGGTFDSNFGTLWLVDLAVDLLKQISFGIANQSTGKSTAYSVIGTLEDWVEVNPDLKTPLGQFSPKYVFLLKKFFNFSAQKAGQPATLASRVLASDGNKSLSE